MILVQSSKEFFTSGYMTRIYYEEQRNQIDTINYLTLKISITHYMNAKEEQTGRPYRQWTDVIDIIRTDLNELRLRPDGDPQYNIFAPPIDAKPKFKVGDVVYYKSERPLNALGQFQPTNTFREGDYRYNIKDAKKIKAILHYPKNIRYMLDGKPKVSYAESELKIKP